MSGLADRKLVEATTLRLIADRLEAEAHALQGKSLRGRAHPQAKVYEALAERDGDECRYCGAEVHQHDHGHRGCDGCAQVDHRLPLARGGTNEVDNLALACPRCNLKKGARTAPEYLLEVARDVACAAVYPTAYHEASPATLPEDLAGVLVALARELRPDLVDDLTAARNEMVADEDAL